ncbi:hypothetical protein VCHA44O286_50343 [Vibrio chagasii]|nr:hypothetical protein VCHA44O286_50343 [Vibrio chagasii]
MALTINVLLLVSKFALIELPHYKWNDKTRKFSWDQKREPNAPLS